MATYTKQFLSASGNNGGAVKVGSTSSPGTQIHNTGGSPVTDEVWLYASNFGNSDLTLTLEYGDTGNSNEIKLVVPLQTGLTILSPGLVLSGNGSVGSTIRAYTTTTNQINIVGYVNRIIP